jgi:hypothetical protein
MRIMTDRPAKPTGAAAERQQRLAKALRTNLLKRKAQARAKQASVSDRSAREDKPGKS